MSSLSASFDLPPAARSVPTARRLVTELLTTWQAPHDLDDAALVVTELVANVVDHVGGEAGFTLELTLAGSWLRLAVLDGSAVRPVVRELEEGAPRGRGLRMVESLAERWGVEDDRGGKRVWVDLVPPVDGVAGSPA